jgi:hypothetical protein
MKLFQKLDNAQHNIRKINQALPQNFSEWPLWKLHSANWWDVMIVDREMNGSGLLQNII